MTNPLVTEYNEIHSAFQRIFNKTDLHELTQNERELPLNSPRLVSIPSPIPHTYYDFIESDNETVRNNAYNLRIRENADLGSTIRNFSPNNANFYEWIVSYLSYAHVTLSYLGYSMSPTLANFQLIPEPDVLYRAVSDPTSSSVTDLDLNDDRDDTSVTTRSDPAIEVQGLTPSSEMIQLMPDPDIYGIKPGVVISLQDLNDDCALVEKTHFSYITRSIPRITKLSFDFVTGVVEQGSNYNDIVRSLWNGDFSSQMRDRAIGLCYRLLSGQICVPDDSELIMPMPRRESRLTWNARTTALFHTLAVFLVVYELKERNAITKQVTNYAYEFLTEQLDFTVSKQRISLRISHTYDSKKFNYSLNDLTTQLKGCDWTGVLWNVIAGSAEPSILTKLYLWIKLLLARSGDAAVRLGKDQTTVPSPFTRQTFQAFPAGSLVPMERFTNEFKRITSKPYDLKPNSITECMYTYPQGLHPKWESDKSDRISVVEHSRCIIVFTALYLSKAYSTADLIQLFPR